MTKPMSEYPIINARCDGKLAYQGYADRAADRFGVSLNTMLDKMLEFGYCIIGKYTLTFRA